MRIALLAALAVLLSGCMCSRVEGSGKGAKETRSLAPFTSVDVSGAFRVAIVVATGVSPRVELEGDDNVLPHVRATVVGERLTLDLDTWSLSPRQPLVATIRTTALRAVETNGAITLGAEGLNADDFTFEANGSAKATLKGQVKRLTLDLNGSAEVDALALTTSTSIVDIAGSGEVSVCATDLLRVDLSGSGDVAYACDPDTIEQDVTGSGRISKK